MSDSFHTMTERWLAEASEMDELGQRYAASVIRKHVREVRAMVGDK
jgi:hypothetical protein